MVLFQGIQCFLKGCGQAFDGCPFLCRPGKDVVVNRTKTRHGGVSLIADAIQSSHQLGCHGEIGVAGGIGGTEFKSNGIRFGRILGDPDGSAAVAAGEDG